jgi:hypothetical protein
VLLGGPAFGVDAASDRCRQDVRRADSEVNKRVVVVVV